MSQTNNGPQVGTTVPMIEVYLLTCGSTGKRYVGVSKNGAKRRFKEHCKLARNGSRTLLHKAMRKHSSDSFSAFVIATVNSWQEAIDLEASSIVKYGTLAPKGYNLTEGGEGTVGYRHKDDSKAAMSAKHKGKVLSVETRQRMSTAQKGKPKPEGFGVRVAQSNRERVLSDETKQKLADHLREVVSRPEVKAKVAAANKARVITLEEKHRLATMNIGRKHRAPEIEKIIQANRRRVWTPEMRANMSAALRKAFARPEVRAKIAAANSRRVWTPEMRTRASAAQVGKSKPRRNAAVNDCA